MEQRRAGQLPTRIADVSVLLSKAAHNQHKSQVLRFNRWRQFSDGSPQPT